MIDRVDRIGRVLEEQVGGHVLVARQPVALQELPGVADWAAEVQSKDVSVKQMYWTLGQYDQVCVIEAPDDETAASVLLTADMLGNIRTQTMRAFTASEMEKILAKVP